MESLREVTNFAYFQLTEHSQTDDIYSTRYAGPITVLSKESYTPIDRYIASDFSSVVIFNVVVTHRTRLSKGLPTDATKLEYRTAADLKIKYGTNLRLGVVRSCDKSS